MNSKHLGLPVAGYQSQSTLAVDTVNENKRIEERLLRRLDYLGLAPSAEDRRWLAIARTHFEQGFMAMNRATFKPGRVDLPEDRADDSLFPEDAP